MESANVVGYVSTANVQAGKFYLIAQHFQTCSGATVDLQDFITSSDMQGGTDDDNSPNLKLWDGSGYVDYSFYSEDMFGEENVWGQGEIAADPVPVSLGEGAFLKTKNNCTITVAGSVAPADEMNVPLVSGKFNLIANPYPVSFDLNGNKVAWADAIVGGTSDDNSPNIKMWDGSGYVDYYFYSEDMFGEENVWGQGEIAADPGEAMVAAGKGFFMKYSTPTANVNLKFSK